MSRPFDVLVVGGGIVGLTAALAMAQRNYSVAVLDAGSLAIETLISDVRVYAVNNASQNLLKSLNVCSHLNWDRIASYSHMHVWDAANGAHIDFDSRYIAASSLGLIIEEAVLKKALLEQIALTPTIQLFSHCPVEEVFHGDKSIGVKSKDSVWEAQLLMVADGANSPTREKLKVPLTTWPYNQQALVATVRTEKPHQQTAYQVFNPEGPLAFLPLSDSQQCSIVWSLKPERAQNLMAVNDYEFNKALEHAFEGRLGSVQLTSSRYQFSLLMRHVQHYTGSRWLLLGDAAHTMHPLAGLGLNVGLADVSSWLQCLDACPGMLASNKALSAYQRERKYAVWQIIMLMEGLKRLFGTTITPISALRGLGLRICNELTPLKRLFIEHATG